MSILTNAIPKEPSFETATNPAPVATDGVHGTCEPPERLAKAPACIKFANTTWPRISPPGFAVVCTLKYTPPLRRLVICAGVRVQRKLEKEPVGNAQATAPFTPATPECRCAAVWLTRFDTVKLTDTVVGDTIWTVPTPLAPEDTGVGCCAPERKPTPLYEGRKI